MLLVTKWKELTSRKIFNVSLVQFASKRKLLIKKLSPENYLTMGNDNNHVWVSWRKLTKYVKSLVIIFVNWCSHLWKWNIHQWHFCNAHHQVMLQHTTVIDLAVDQVHTYVCIYIVQGILSREMSLCTLQNFLAT